MSLELLNRGKEAGCLSAWQVSQLTLGLLKGEPAAHVESCELCAQRVAAETKQLQGASYERVPAILLSRAGRASWWVRIPPGRWMLGFVALALLAAGALAWMGGRALQGKPWVLASVLRQGTEVAQQLPADQLGKLMPGDQLRLRLAPHSGVWTRVQVRQGSKWEPFFEGLIPEDGWLPAGLTVEQGKTQVRVWSCARVVPEGASATGAGCKHKQLTL